MSNNERNPRKKANLGLSFRHVGILVQNAYFCTNRTRHASRQISVPGRVLFFVGYAI